LIFQAAVKVLSGQWPVLGQYAKAPWPTEVLRERFSEVKMACRLEVVEGVKNGKKVIIDVGHNFQAIERILESPVTRKYRKVKLVYGSKSGRDLGAIFGLLAGLQDEFVEEIFFVRSGLDATMTSGAFVVQAAGCRFAGYQILFDGEIRGTLDHLVNQEDSESLILVLGSFSIMQETRNFFEIDDETDAFYMNEGPMVVLNH
jgi:folylpolyglutamate synthase/dihydropteroate synthase